MFKLCILKVFVIVKCIPTIESRKVSVLCVSFSSSQAFSCSTANCQIPLRGENVLSVQQLSGSLSGLGYWCGRSMSRATQSRHSWPKALELRIRAPNKILLSVSDLQTPVQINGTLHRCVKRAESLTTVSTSVSNISATLGPC